MKTLKTVRVISAPALALVVALALLAPTPALGQHVKVFDGRAYGYLVPTAPNQLVRVTVANPHFVAPTDTSEAHVDFYLKLDGVDGDISSHTVEPGGSYTYTLDPRSVGQLADPKSGLRHVPVRFRVEVEVLEGRPALQPTVLIEVVNARTGEVMSFHAFPGFTGGVYVAAGDVN
jgi:hypothetical protein